MAKHARTSHRSGLLALAASAGLAATPAQATWSIVIVNTRTKEVGLASATCLTNFDLQANTPIMLVGIGGGTAQSYVDQSGQNKVFVRDQLQRGTDPEDILTLLEAFDTGHQTRQYGIADTLGRAATFSGTGDGAWAGGVTGQVGDLVYTVQGNVLTGEPVVTAAAEAIVGTPGDIPEKLMAAMEAARSFGGDGRCSCTNGGPEDCGSPPPDFEKSAHIAYMISARIGDRDGANGIYRAGSQPAGLASHDFNGDGLPDLVAAASASNDLMLLLNATRPGDSFVTFSAAQPIALPAASRSVAVADLNKDGIPDLVAANQSANTVSVLPGLPSGGFGAASASGVGADPRYLVVADIDGDKSLDVATANGAGSSISVLYGDGAGGFSQIDEIAVGGGINNLAAADLDADGDLDLIFAAQSIGSLPTIYNHGGRVFKFGNPLGTGGNPRWVLARDFDHDGRTDVAAATGSSGKVTLMWNRVGGFVRQDLACGGTTVNLAVGDANGDHMDDLFVLRSSPQDFLVYVGDGKGGFELAGPFIDGGGNTLAALADLDGDGLDDLAAIAGGTRSVYIVENLGHAGEPVVFNSGLGTATGDYFMDFNIAFQKAQDPDPVYQLRDQFEAWRQNMIGRPDAEASLVSIEPAVLPADGKSQAVLEVALLDWNGNPVAGDPGLSVVHAPGADPVCQIGMVEDLGGGRYRATITAGQTPGIDAFRIVADDGMRPVTLTPDAPLTLIGGCAADCDASGLRDLFDFLCFVNRFNAGSAEADCDGSQSLDLFDFLCFVNAFNQGC